MPSPQLLAFVASRLPMVVHDFSRFDGGTPEFQKGRDNVGKYSLQQAFFYAVGLWIAEPPLVSERAYAYAKENWGDQCERIWNLKRAEIPKLDGCKISQSGLIYEHVTTGSMFREYLLGQLDMPGGALDARVIATWLKDNYCTAWVHREEDRVLTASRYKSKRGASLRTALAAYKECGIEIRKRPGTALDEVHVGAEKLDFESDERIDRGSSLTPVKERDVCTGHPYSLFFTAVNQALREICSTLTIGVSGAYHATVRGFDTGDIQCVLVLDGPRGAKVKTPVLSIESPTECAATEPDTENWAAMRTSFFGAQWRTSYGSHDNQPEMFCRLKRPVADAFVVSNEDTRIVEAKQAARTLEEMRQLLAAAKASLMETHRG